MTRLDPSPTGAASALSEAYPATPTIGRGLRRQLGAYYTPRSTASVMTEWAVRSPSDRVLEPSFGDGAFLAAVQEIARAREWSDVTVIGAEIDERAFGEGISRGLISDDHAIRSDFLAVEPFPVDGVLGNPPYVRLRHLPADQRDRALVATEKALGVRMDPSGSLWMPFVLHATQFLRPGGRLALVLPYELTYVRYARPLWEYLGRTFGELTVLRVHDRLFPDILQEAVVLLADGKGRRTSKISLKAFESVGALASDDPAATTQIALERVVAGDRAFIEALLPHQLQGLLAEKAHDLTQPAKHQAQFHIGYVSGDKEFFHPAPDRVAQYGLEPVSLRRTVTSTRKLKGGGLWTSGLGDTQHEHLFLPTVPDALPPGEAAYVQFGEHQGVDRRYKCRVRKPWFLVPSVTTPDVILSVFCEQPLLMLNDADFAASNSLLCGYLTDPAKRAHFAAAWYTSLTALQCEMHVHSLGGGVLVLVPREAGSVRLSKVDEASPSHLSRLDRLLRADRVTEAYESGDNAVLRRQGFSSDEISLVQEGVAVLRHWRSGRPS